MTQKHKRARSDIHQTAAFDTLLVGLELRASRVECDAPAAGIKLMRNAKRHRLMVGVQQQQKILVLRRPARTVAYLRGAAVQEHSEGAHPAAILPILRLHALAVGTEPDGVLVRMMGFGVMVVESEAMEVRMCLA